MSKYQDEILSKLCEIGKPIDVVNIDFSHHVPKLLRSWADQIESGEISIKNAVLTIDAAKSPDLQTINIVTTNQLA